MCAAGFEPVDISALAYSSVQFLRQLSRADIRSVCKVSLFTEE